MSRFLICSWRRRRGWLVGVGFLGLMLLLGALEAVASSPPGPEPEKFTVKMTHACIITPQFAKMKDFYQRLLQVEPKKFQEDYVEFQIPGAIVSLYEEASLAQIAPAAVPKPGAGGVMLEFQVADVDREFERLHSLGLKIEFIMPPTTFPWGNRSTYLRDPDGNLVNVYSLVAAPK